MKKLLIHIGYPKTATTTLQQQVFLGLHDAGKINYLGRVQKSKIRKEQKDSLSKVDIVANLRKHLLFGEKLRFSVLDLSKDKLNVISDEDLTLHNYFHKVRFGVDINPLDYPNSLKNIFGRSVEINVLATLRNQADLIFSCFVQKYPFLRPIHPEISFSGFIRNKPDNFFDIFNFNKVLETYEQVFNSKITIAFFEDFLQDPKVFWNKLSEILPGNAFEIEAYKGTVHHNKKVKTSDYVESYYNNFTVFGKLLSSFYGYDNEFLFKLNRRHNLNTFALKKFESKLLLKRIPERIKVPENSDIDHLREVFRKSNIKLANKYHIDEDKLRLYKYL